MKEAIESEVMSLRNYRSHVLSLWGEKLRADMKRRRDLATLRALLKWKTGRATREEFVGEYGEPEQIEDQYLDGWSVASWDAVDTGWPDHWVNAKPPPVPEGCTPVSFGEGENLPAMTEVPLPVALVTAGDAAAQVLAQIRYTLDVAKAEAMRRSVQDADKISRALHRVRMLLLWVTGRGVEAEVAEAIGVPVAQLGIEANLEASYPWGDSELHDPNVIDVEPA